jgi:hypothetical protein
MRCNGIAADIALNRERYATIHQHSMVDRLSSEAHVLPTRACRHFQDGIRIACADFDA